MGEKSGFEGAVKISYQKCNKLAKIMVYKDFLWRRKLREIVWIFPLNAR